MSIKMCHIRTLNGFVVYLFLAICFSIVPVWIYYRTLSKHRDGFRPLPNFKYNLMAQSEYIERLEHLSKMCSIMIPSYDDSIDYEGITKDMLDHILVDQKHHLLYCYVPKVACTNWKRVFMIMTGTYNYSDPLLIAANIAHNRSLYHTLSNYSRSDAFKMIRTYTKFLFVRHPFERLLSAYRNKFEHNNVKSKYFQDRLGKYIVKKYRHNYGNASLVRGDDVSFEEFTTYLTQTPIESLNEHWKPVTNLCGPCSVKYDFVGKYETLYSDARFLLTGTGLSHIRFPHSVKTSGTSKELSKYFSNLTYYRIKELFDIYKDDFKLFSYNLQDLLGFDIG